MLNTKRYVSILLVMGWMMLVGMCQIARDIALKYLYLDTNGDNLVSSAELAGIKDVDYTANIQYYYWRKYQTYKYPQQLLRKYDLNQDGNLAYLQFHQIIQAKVKKHQQIGPKGAYNLLNYLKSEDYFTICDTDNNQYISQAELLVCVQAFVIHQFKNYPYKIKCLLYPNRTIGYDFEEFKMLLPKAKKQDDVDQLKKLFDSFEWPESKIKEDTDLLIGPEEGKFMQPTMIYFYLDTNWDELLDPSEVSKYFSKHGGDQAFRIADYTGDGKLDQAQLIAYYMFAMCIDDCEQQTQQQQEECKFSNDQEAMFSRKYQTSQAICNILQGLLQATPHSQAPANHQQSSNEQL